MSTFDETAGQPVRATSSARTGRRQSTAPTAGTVLRLVQPADRKVADVAEVLGALALLQKEAAAGRLQGLIFGCMFQGGECSVGTAGGLRRGALSALGAAGVLTAEIERILNTARQGDAL